MVVLTSTCLKYFTLYQKFIKKVDMKYNYDTVFRKRKTYWKTVSIHFVWFIKNYLKTKRGSKY